MVILNKPKGIQIGLLAEDQSDVDVARAIFEKYTDKNAFSIKKFVGNGCGKLKNKCRTWTENLFARGCQYVVIFHDLDRNNEAVLRKKLLEKIPIEKFPNSIIIIPKEEVEAWLLSDENALRSVFSLKTTPKRYANCESISSPKSEIARLIWVMERKKYINTIHNQRIAEKTSLINLRRCPSFQPLDKYLLEVVF